MRNQIKKRYFFNFFLILLIFSCKEKDKKISSLTLVRYTDSSYTQKIDSIQVDTICSSDNGFVKIYGYGGIGSFEKGELKQGRKIGKWYRFFYGKKVSEIISYNLKGEYEGEYKEFFVPQGALMTAFNYKNNKQLGEQREYYANGNLALLYTKDGNEGYEGKYLALGEKGDTLYYINLGKEGSGYLKQYNRFGKLEKEGSLVGKKYQGVVKEYEYDSDKCTYIHLYNYQPDSISFIKKIKLQ